MTEKRLRERRTCVRCVMDESDGGITFDATGVCSHCRAVDASRAGRFVDDATAARSLERIVGRIRADGRGGEYDCLLGLSGGIDSSYLALKVVDFGLRPLVAHVDTGWNSDVATANIEGVVKSLGLDLITEVIDWDEMRRLQTAFLRAGVANQDAPQDHAIFATLYRLAKEHGLRHIPCGMNNASESVLPTSWGYDALDSGHIVAINRLFGDGPLETFPLLSFRDYCAINWGVPEPFPARMEPLLDFLPYEREAALAELRERTGFRDYGGKHGESRFTKFFQGYLLPTRFGYDKRRAHLSSLILSGQMSREAALAELARPAYDPETLAEEKAFIARKLRLPMETFDALIAAPARHFMDYPNNHLRARDVARLAGALARTRADIEDVIETADRAAGLTATLWSLDDAPRNRPLYVYGGGAFGARAMARLKEIPGADPRGFIDSFKSGALSGAPVLSLEAYLTLRRSDHVVLICSQFADEIAEALQTAGVHGFLRVHPQAVGLAA